jgi:DNA-directed RNA polymerase omega subunit
VDQFDQIGKIDSKYRFIILASKRAKQLLKGAKPKLQTRSRNPIRIAQAEVRDGLIEYEIIPARMDDIPERDDRIFAGAGIPAIVDEAGDSESPLGKDIVEDDADIAIEAESEEDEGGDEDAEEDDVKDDKDE